MNIKNFYNGGTNRPFRLTGTDGRAGPGYTESNVAGEVFKVGDIIRLGDDVRYGYVLKQYYYWIPDLGGACRGSLCYVNSRQTGTTPSIYLTLKTGLGSAAASESKFVAESASVAGDTIRNSRGENTSLQDPQETSVRTCGAPLEVDVFPALVITTAHAAGTTKGTNFVGDGTAPQYSVIQFGDDVSWCPSTYRR